MAKLYQFVYLIAIIIITTVFVEKSAAILTAPHDVVALQDLYKTLDQPPQLKGWRLDAGWDPCNNPKYECTGVVCSGSSVRYLVLKGLNLTGYISEKISYLTNLRHLDLSSNNIGGEIPDVLSRIKSLKYVNLSHNLLSGHIGNALITGLPLRTMDLSYNNLTGDLPSSFRSLTNLSGLYLQNNRFTGSVSCLAELPLQDLYIQHNYFSGIIPKHFQSIRNLRFGGNRFHLQGDKYPPHDVPSEYKAKPYNKILLVLQPGGITFPYWTVNGLWAEQLVQAVPNSDYVYYNQVIDCDAELAVDVNREVPWDLRLLLVSIWRTQNGTTDRTGQLWSDEFIKHGSCTQDILPTPADYFRKAIELYANLNVDSIISPEGKYKPGNPFQTSDLLDDIRFYNRAQPILECEGNRLVKVEFCYTTHWKLEYCFPKLPGPNTKSCPESIQY